MRIADADAGLRHVFLHGMILQVSIGVHAHEKTAAQRVRINVDLGVPDEPGVDRIDGVVDYEVLAGRVRQIAAARHFNLVETLAERIVQDCLRDARVQLARVRIEKLDVFTDICAAGVEIERRQPTRHPPPPSNQ